MLCGLVSREGPRKMGAYLGLARTIYGCFRERPTPLQAKHPTLRHHISVPPAPFWDLRHALDGWFFAPSASAWQLGRGAETGEIIGRNTSCATFFRNHTIFTQSIDWPHSNFIWRSLVARTSESKNQAGTRSRYGAIDFVYFPCVPCVSASHSPAFRVGQNRFIYGNFGREITKYTVIYGVHIRFWPTLVILNCQFFSWAISSLL